MVDWGSLLGMKLVMDLMSAVRSLTFCEYIKFRILHTVKTRSMLDDIG